MSTKRKVMLKGAIIGAIVGFIIGVIISVIVGGPPIAIFAAMWYCIGFGGNIDFISNIPGVFSTKMEKYGFEEAVKTIIAGLIFVLIFTILGPISFLVRFFIFKND